GGKAGQWSASGLNERCGEEEERNLNERSNGPVLPRLKYRFDIKSEEEKSVDKTGFRSIPLIPTPEELLDDRRIDLPINKIEESYESIDEYLETHYSLMREDFIRSLRVGIQRLRNPDKVDKDKDRNTDIRIYEHTMKFAIVASRPLELLGKPYDLQVEVSFKPEDAEFVWPEKGYTMVESTTYFEAYRHIMNVLQNLDPKSLPFKSQIVDLVTDIDEPEYLKRRHPVYEFKNISSFEKIKENYGTSRIDISKEWPPLEILDTSLHSSQYEALKQMLTKRLALIQGPPGTGKTYVGLTAVQLLIENTSGTIMIACQTNHALDQFLEGIQKFEPKIVRLGSRSQNEEIKKLTLFEIRRELKLSDQESTFNPDANRLFRERKMLEKEMKPLLEEIHNPCVTMEFIQKEGILTEKQIASLKEDDDDWVTTAEFQGVDEGKTVSGEYVIVRSDTFVASTYVNEDDLKKYMDYENLSNVPQYVRAAMHNKWRQKRLDFVNNKLYELNKKYSKLCEQIKYERIREDLMILKDARVVGMTTTAAAKYHELIMNLEPKILIVEEAAETVESHIITALTPTIEHLILIGDHKQLRPNISVHELAEKHFLDVSLFERLTKKLDYTPLTEQRRMRKEISKLLEPIYGDTLTITDHESVKEYPRIPGLFHDLFFFDHQEEESSVKDSTSKINKFEAQLCAKFACFLANGGIEPEKIMYSSQRKEIKKVLRDESRKVEVDEAVKDIHVSSVDGFQGEENDVIILSLVRSRDPRCGIGFLSVSNRDACGQSLMLFCQKHSNFETGLDGLPKQLVITSVTWAGDIPSSGGCARKCEEIMACGH
ncbi:15877_t:CDS:10, partial [Racocetra fulgida]